MTEPVLVNDPAFLAGGGDMGRLMREYDWAATALGLPGSWPQSLRTAVRLLLNTGHPMYIFWGPDALCLYNDAYRPSIGPERHPSSLGKPARSVWDEIWDAIGPQIAQVMSGLGATWHVDQLLPIIRNGVREDVYWTYSYGPIDDETAPGGVGGVLVVCTETTGQVRLTQRLRESEGRLQLALSAGRGVGTWDWDVPNDRVVTDERFARLYSIDPAMALAGAPLTEFFKAMHPDDVDWVCASIQRALRTGETFSSEYRLVDPQGKTKWMLAEGRCEMAPDGTPLRFPGVSFDITDRKVAEQKLRELNADLEREVVARTFERGRLWQVNPELLGVLNGAGYFESSNPAWQAVLGWTQEEVASKVFFEFIHPDDIARTQVAWDDANQRGMPALRFENRYQRKDGAYRWLSWLTVPEGGKVYCSARDITQEKERIEALRSTEDALRQAQKMEAVGQLTGGIAHDFNNLLAAISGSLQMIERNALKGNVQNVERFAGIGRGAVSRAAALTHRLLAFSRRQTLEAVPTDMNRLIAGMEDLIRRTVGPSIDMEVVGAAGLWSTFVDRNQLENALLNLCINARDAMPDGGRLTIETANKWLDDRAAMGRDLDPGQYVSLCVTDTGVGMSPEVVAQAFDPFFTTKPIGQGTGLGLSMTYGFARQSGGHVRIYSELAKGTTLCIYLPRHDHQPDSGHEQPAHVTPMPSAETNQVIMIIDDEAAIRTLLVEVFEQAGYATIEANDGPSGLRILQSDARVDLLITDVGLPGGLNGRQVADAARAARPDLKVLFITGYAENAVVGNGHLERWMAVVTKPFEMDALAAKVRIMLDQDGAPLW